MSVDVVAVAVAEPEPAPVRTFEEEDEQFFLSEGSLAPTELVVASALDEEEPAPLSRAERIASPRRRALARWVGVVVAAFAVFCVAAFATKRAPSPPSPPPPALATVAAPLPPPPSPAPVEVPTPPPAAAAPPETSAKPDPGRAVALREVARTALSRGALDTAIERGTESVEADPSDAEAWLVLGAAQMAKGQSVESRSTFVACTKMATRGPRNECFQML